MRFIFSCAAFVLAAAIVHPAYACTTVSGYRVPTNLQLAERADTIVIGTVTGFGGDDASMTVTVKPTVLLKGTALPDAVRMVGYSPESTRERMRRSLSNRGSEPALIKVTRSDPGELRQPNPDALMGACTRYLFEPRMKLVLFLKRDETGELRFMAYPFARVSEDVPSDDALWVQAVRMYVEIAALPAGVRHAALLARRDCLRATGDADSLLLANDIDVELKADRD